MSPCHPSQAPSQAEMSARGDGLVGPTRWRWGLSDVTPVKENSAGDTDDFGLGIAGGMANPCGYSF